MRETEDQKINNHGYQKLKFIYFGLKNQLVRFPCCVSCCAELPWVPDNVTGTLPFTTLASPPPPRSGFAMRDEAPAKLNNGGCIPLDPALTASSLSFTAVS